MEATAYIQGRTYALNALQAARIVSEKFGFDDLDAEPTGGGGWKVTIRSKDGVGITFSSSKPECDNLILACEKLIEAIGKK